MNSIVFYEKIVGTATGRPEVIILYEVSRSHLHGYNFFLENKQ